MTTFLRPSWLAWLGATSLALSACAQTGSPNDGATSDTNVADSASPTDTSVESATPIDAIDDTTQLTPDMLPDGEDVDLDAAPPALLVGGTARVTATALNLRTGPSTSDTIITAMPCGSEVTLLAGPNNGWWNVQYMTDMGWSFGGYLVPSAAFDPSVCGASASDGGTSSDAATITDASMSSEVDMIFQRARYGVGYSYYWGHGSWRTDGLDPGSCSGSCPSCTHTGQYGADCSGFVAKVWQIPGPSPLTTDAHPYSTYNFYNQMTYWSQVPRASIQPADALVYNNGSSGHIMLFESGTDPWGNIWTYEARGCATGIVHNLRVADSTYIAIRRQGL